MGVLKVEGGSLSGTVLATADWADQMEKKQNRNGQLS